MGITAAEIAREIGGEVEGDGSRTIVGLAGLAEAGEGDISFLTQARYAAAAAGTRAAVVIVGKTWQGECPAVLIRVDDPDSAFAKVAPMLVPPPARPEPGVHPTAVVAADVSLGRDVSIGPHCVLEPGVKIGDFSCLGAGCYIGHQAVVGGECLLYQHVSVRERVTIGDRVIVHNGAVIGSDGFGYTREGEAWRKIPQVGTVEVGDDVEIGANSTIDRARFGKTVIGRGVKIDNLVQIAHNVTVGENTAMAAQVGVAGSTSIGRNVQLGGQAGVAGHLHIGDHAVVGGQAGVLKDVPASTFVSGYPAMPHNKARRTHASLMRLPELRQKVSELERRLDGKKSEPPDVASPEQGDRP